MAKPRQEAVWALRPGLGQEGPSGGIAGPPRSSCGVQEALPKQSDAGPPILQVREQLEPVDLALGLAVAPGQFDRGADCGLMAQQPCGEVTQLRQVAASGRTQPGLQRGDVVRAHKAAELHGQSPGGNAPPIQAAPEARDPSQQVP